MEPVTVRRYRDGDEKGIVDLLDLTFGRWPHLDIPGTPIDYWRWKYKGNPEHGSSITVGEAGGRIVGCHHRIILRAKVMDDILLAGTAVDFAVHPDHRGRGLSNRISEANDEIVTKSGVKMDYWITSNPLLIKSYSSSKDPSKHRPRFPHKIVNLTRIRNIDRQLSEMPVPNSWVKRIGFYALSARNKAGSILQPRQTRTGFTLARATRFDDRIDALWERVKDSHDFIVERRKDYLNWRYCDKRAGDFAVAQAEDGAGAVPGYAAFRINRFIATYPVGYIVDLLTLPGRLDVADALAEEATRFFDGAGVNIVNAQVVKGHPHEGVLSRYGFLDSQIDINLFYQENADATRMKEIANSPPERIHLTWGDHDVLPVKMPTAE
jgi:GNAT superfamily N-acetyltransferase